MDWTDRDPPGTDPLLQMTIPHDGGGAPCRLEIDKLPDGHYRVTVGTPLEALELCRTSDLELLLRHTYRLGVSGSFREVLAALQQLSELAGDRPAGNSTTRPSAAAGGNGGAASNSAAPGAGLAEPKTVLFFKKKKNRRQALADDFTRTSA